jgi:hypothetical protein
MHHERFISSETAIVIDANLVAIHRFVSYQSISNTFVQLFCLRGFGFIASSHPMQPGALSKSSSEGKPQ